MEERGREGRVMEEVVRKGGGRVRGRERRWRYIEGSGDIEKK